MRVFPASAVLLTILTSSAFAAPPASCARKYLGPWSWNSSTGIHVDVDFRSDGIAYCSNNAFCHVFGNWSCSGNNLIYNNSIDNTTLTLSADGRTLTGMGGSPPNLQTVTRTGPAPASEVGHLQAAEPEANSLMTRAQAAERYCNYSSQMRASDTYYAAARLFAKQGDSAQQARAEAAGQAASDHADQCAKKPSRAQAPSSSKSCEMAREQAKTLTEAGGDITALRAKLRGLHCNL